MKRFVLSAAMLGVMCAATSFGLNVSISGTNATRDASLIDFITNNIEGATVTYGNYSDPANIPADTELFVIGRNLSSSAYANATNSATFNALEIPIICCTSYVARPDSDRWGWHDGALTGGWEVPGDETTVTSAGAGFLGVPPGTVDWFTAPTAAASFWGTGTGSVGEGHILATLGGEENILAAGWNAGELSGTGVAFGGNRLLFNLPQDPDNNSAVVVPSTTEGQSAMSAMINAVLGNNPFGNIYISNPYPTDKATGVELDVTLGWDGTPDPADANLLDPNVKKYYVYIDDDNKDTDPNLYYDGEVVVMDWSNRAASYGPLSLSLDQDVNWQIEEGLDNGSGSACPPGDPNNVHGPIWSFGARRSIPVVPADQPVSVRAFPADGAVFTVDFSSISDPTVKWYKDDNTTVAEITAGIITTNNGGGSYTTTLDLGTSVGVSDEGQYYCSVTNDGGLNWYDSGIGNLVLKRKLAEYAFDGDLTDTSGNSAPTGTAMDSLGDPNTLSHIAGTIHYVDGADGVADSAVYLDSNEYINFGVEGYPKANAVTANGFGGGLDDGTIVFWIKPNEDVQQTILGNFNDGSTTGFLSILQADHDQRLYIRETDGGSVNVEDAQPDRPEYDLTDGTWHMMAACWSGGDTATLYVDGQYVNSGTFTAPISYEPWQRGTLLGATRTSADRTFLSDMFAGGAIDNLRIYNYRLDDGNIIDAFAQEYLDNTGIQPCINMSFLEGLPSTNVDNTGSSYCKVDLADFAAFAETWLTNGLY